jgi:hypothetical protein
MMGNAVRVWRYAAVKKTSERRIWLYGRPPFFDLDGNATRTPSPSLSLLDGAPGFAAGEYILVRIPESIQLDGHIKDTDDETSTCM